MPNRMGTREADQNCSREIAQGGAERQEDPQTLAIRQRRGVPITLYLFGGIQDDISVLPDQALSQ